MPGSYRYSLNRALGTLTASFLIVAGCTVGQRDEIIAGISVPIPGGMRKADEERIELEIPGIGAGHMGYRGSVPAEEIFAFYQQEMPARRWNPDASVVGQGGILVYSKDNQNLLIIVSKGTGETPFAVAVGQLGPPPRP